MRLDEVAGTGAEREVGGRVEVYRGTAPADRFELKLASFTAADSPYSKEKDSQS